MNLIQVWHSNYLGCGKKRSDPGLLNENALSSEAAILAEKMLSDIQQYELFQNKLQVQKFGCFYLPMVNTIAVDFI